MDLCVGSLTAGRWPLWNWVWSSQPRCWFADIFTTKSTIKRSCRCVWGSVPYAHQSSSSCACKRWTMTCCVKFCRFAICIHSSLEWEQNLWDVFKRETCQNIRFWRKISQLFILPPPLRWLGKLNLNLKFCLWKFLWSDSPWNACFTKVAYFSGRFLFKIFLSGQILISFSILMQNRCGKS